MPESEQTENLEPARKKQRREISQDELQEWDNYLNTRDDKETSCTEIQRHWHVTTGPPQLPDDLKQVIEADRESVETLNQLQRPIITRIEAMRVCSGPRVNSATFFEDVLEITRSVRAKEKKGAARAKQEPIPASSSIVSSSIATKPLRRMERDVSNPRATPMHGMPLALRGKSHRQKKIIPIIIVPNAATALINIHNAKDFLEDGRWINPGEKRKALAAANGGKLPREESVIISSKQLVKPQEQAQLGAKFDVFKVTDSPLKLKASEWDHVCGCFVSGNLWQFERWFSENPVEIFAKLAGFHLTFAEDRPHQTTSKWSVKQLKIGRAESARHMDRKVAKEFWKALYHFLRTSDTFLQSA
uniref:Cell division control protein 73 C-terminal domain-containing protein n=1 Tax=Eutreptiella gymnastica TaxID=73025 RepID=A0A7S4FXQ2_9EUGL